LGAWQGGCGCVVHLEDTVYWPDYELIKIREHKDVY
jgi:hypothetical protein